MKSKYRLVRVDMVTRKGQYREEVKLSYYSTLASLKKAKVRHEYSHDFCVPQKKEHSKRMGAFKY